MLVIGLVIAFVIYVGLYWIYIAAQAHPPNATATSFLSVLNQILLTPENNIFFLLRGLILVTFFYVLADLITSPARKGMKNRRHARLNAERDAKAFKGVRPAGPPNEDDDSLDLVH
jgi:hypothetical protein